MGVDKNDFTDSSTPENRKTIPAESSALSLESAYGSVKPSAKPEDWNEVTRRAKDAKADKTVRELREQCEP